MKPVVVWLGHAGFRLEGSAIVYIDPYKLREHNPPKADFILVTHSHFDHYSEADIKKIAKDDTVIISTPDVVEQYKGKKMEIRPGEELSVGPIKVKAVPAYNITKSFHQKKSGWVGFVLTLDGVTFYHAGDTDAVEEMKELKVDVALLPVGGT
ncbi:MAG: MBL fold metallo-hydrolase, partial [bacterium]